MIAIAAAVATYAIALAVDASGLSASANGPFQVLSTGASLVVQVIVMVLAGALAVTASGRGWRVAGRLTGDLEAVSRDSCANPGSVGAPDGARARASAVARARAAGR